MRQDSFETTIFNENKNFRFSEINDLLIDRQGFIWIAMDKHGLFRINGDESINFYKNNSGLLGADIEMIHEEADGSLFVSGDHLYQFDSNVERFTKMELKAKREYI